MKAVIQTRYGTSDDLDVRDVPKPEIGLDEVLVRVAAASLHADVWHVVAGRPYVLRLFGAGVLRPKQPIPGTDLAGTVEAVGRNVTEFAPGDRVFGETHTKLQWNNGGAFAEYAAVPAQTLVKKPENVSFEEAASVPTSGYIAVLNLPGPRNVGPGKKVLVNGAGGAVGSIALQIAKARGAIVTAVEHTDKLDLVRSLGADAVIDYTREDFTKGEERYDLVFDVASTLDFDEVRRVLTDDGLYVLIGHDHFGGTRRPWFGEMPRMFRLMFRTPFDRHLPPMNFDMPPKKDVMRTLAEHLEKGQLTPVVGKVFPLGEVREAMRALQEGRIVGKILLAPGAAEAGGSPH